MNLLNRLQLKDKLLVLGLLPAATLAIILSIYFTNTRLTDIDELLKQSEQNITVTLSKSSVYGVFTGNIELLDSLLQSVRENPDIAAVKISNQQGDVLSFFDKEISYSARQNTIHITRKIIIETANVNDEIHDMMLGGLTEKDDSIGVVTVTFSRHAAMQRQQSILINSFYITALLLIGIGLIAHQISRTIGKPILKLALAVDAIKQGKYAYQAPSNKNNDEVSRLEAGVQNMAAELKEHRQQLEHKIAEATKELEEKNLKLNNAQQKIIKAADAKSRFVSHISHEIRTPLNSIIGFLELIQTTPLNTEQKEMVSASLFSSKNLHQIVNEVLDIAQLQAHKVKLNKGNFDLHQASKAAITSLSTQASHKNITLNFNYDSSVPNFIKQDPLKIQQVLINLLNNAIKFSSEGSPITLRVFEDPSATNVITFEIEDYGTGIDEKDIPTLFDEFSQIGNGDGGKGSGLGLTISNHLAEALGGQLNVESRIHEGSIFRFFIPYEKADNTGPNNAPYNLSTEQDFNLDGLHVLVADDNEMNSLLLSKLFERNNISTSTVKDDQEALELSRIEKFDFLLLDLRMPFLTGDKILDKIRANTHNLNQQTPAIAVTAHITSGAERASYINSFDGYLTKPIDQVSLFSMMSNILHDLKELEEYAEQQKVAPIKKPPESLFNLSQALLTMNHDKELLCASFKTFTSELPNQIESIKRAINANDHSVAADIVHKIHGSAAYCGTNRLKEEANHFERILRNLSKATAGFIEHLFFDAVKELLSEQDSIVIRINVNPDR